MRDANKFQIAYREEFGWIVNPPVATGSPMNFPTFARAQLWFRGELARYIDTGWRP